MNPRAEPGKRAQQKLAHRQAILDAAESSFGVRHPAEVAVDEIAAGAGVAKGTVYNYFTDKVSLVNSVSRRIQLDTADRVAAAVDALDSPSARIAMGLCVLLRVAIDHPRRAMILSQLVMDGPDFPSPLIQVLRAELRRGIESKELIAPNLDAALMLLLGVARGSMMGAVNAGGTGVSRERGSALVVHCLRALGVDAEASDLCVRAAFERLGLASAGF